MKVIVFLLVFGSFQAHAKDNFKVYHFQWHDNKQCQQHADEIAENISNQLNQEVTLAACEYVSSTKRTNLVFAVKGESRPRVVSTYRGSIYDPRGFHRSLEACQKAMDAERRFFSTATGLDATVSFCGQDAAHRRNPWYAHIVGFGTPKLQPRRATWFSAIPYVEDYPKFRQDIADKLRDYNILMSHITFRNRSISGGATLQFYTSPDIDRVSLDSKLLVSVLGKENCFAVQKKLESEITNSNSSFKYITSYCESGYSNPKSFDLNVAFLQTAWAEPKYSQQTFNSFAACEAQREKIVSQLAQIHSRSEVVASACGAKPYSSEDYKKIFRVGALLQRKPSSL